jgi:hypothetical protein
VLVGVVALNGVVNGVVDAKVCYLSSSRLVAADSPRPKLCCTLVAHTERFVIGLVSTS